MADLVPAEHEAAWELDRVQSWRFEVLFDAGFDFLSALALAVNGSVDLHVAVRLLEQGCTPDLAQEILI